MKPKKISLEHLTELQRFVAQESGTEHPFTGKLLNEKREGKYFCVCCEELLFISESKFDAGCGWPSFFETASNNSVRYLEDHSMTRMRIEIRCGNCDAHLGHVFDDGPAPTFKRYCLNSAALKFVSSDSDVIVG